MNQTTTGTIDDPRWPAVIARDAAADGQFVYAVLTTGIYCRPSCPSRRARPEHVSFHDSAADAERAGYRACRRCRPDQLSPAQERARIIAALCRHIETAEETPGLEELAARAGWSPWHLHRTFKAHTGLTPHAYAAARRAQRLQKELPGSETVTQAIHEAGYRSSARFYSEAEQVLGMTPQRYRAGGLALSLRSRG
ncbi:MAG: bifunctional transcriptional activator/DNA repair enzyme AdaA, partial [Pseudomonadota bacterium]